MAGLIHRVSVVGSGTNGKRNQSRAKFEILQIHFLCISYDDSIYRWSSPLFPVIIVDGCIFVLLVAVARVSRHKSLFSTSASERASDR
jgi:hypothetical protein